MAASSLNSEGVFGHRNATGWRRNGTVSMKEAKSMCQTFFKWKAQSSDLANLPGGTHTTQVLILVSNRKYTRMITVATEN